MSEKSEQFEQMVANVHELLEGQGAEILWNERIPDPDNPGQPRQIDVLIRNGDLLNIVECRIHKAKQDVKWIEELIGRRASLNANAVIAVSASGFTSGAIKKAAKYGVVLNDLLSLTPDEIASWAKSIRVSLFFYRYSDFEIFLYFRPQDVVMIDPEMIADELKRYEGLRAIFNAPNGFIDEQKLIVEEYRKKKVHFKVHFRIDGFSLQGKEVIEIETRGGARVETITLNVPMTLAYGGPSARVEDRNVFIQQYDLGQTRIVHHDGRISMCLDLSKLEAPPFWQFRFFEVAAQEEYYHEKLEIIEPQNVNMRIDKCKIAIGSIDV